MTSLDDALNSSAPVFHPSELYAEWRELPDNNNLSTNLDNPRELGTQLLSYSVVQSLDDGLPDPVTMTSGSEASGKITASLAGRQGVYADTLLWRTGLASGTGTGTSITTGLPADTTWGDYSIVAVSLNSNTVVLTDTDQDGRNDWALLGAFDDGATIKTWVYGREFFSGSSGPVLTLSASASYSWVGVSVSGKTANGSNTVPLKPGTAVGVGEAASVTVHSTPSATLSRRGYVVGIWSRLAASVGWTPGAGVELNEVAATVDLAISTTPLREPGDYVITGTTSAATAVATMIAVPLMVMDRPVMDAVAYFSPFNRNSPLYGFDRDRAPLSALLNVVTDTGVVGTDIFHGQMADIGVKGRTAELSGVSKTRLDLDRSLVLPRIWGLREGCGIDWVATWIMARASQFSGPAPNPLTVLWVPCYGSIHSVLSKASGFNLTHVFDADPDKTQPYGRTPIQVPGPFHSGMFARQTATETHELILTTSQSVVRPVDTNVEVLPHIAETYPNGVFNDQMSQACSQGRMTVWLKADPVTHNPTYMAAPATDSFIFKYDLYALSPASTFLGHVGVTIQSVDRQVVLLMSSATGGLATVLMVSLGLFPNDGAWHFFGVSWDWKSGEMKVKIDGAESASTYWRDTLPTFDTDVPLTDAAGIAAGGTLTNYTKSHVPMSDFQVEAGPTAYSGPWTTHYPTPAAPGVNAITRPTYQTLEGLAEVAPIQGWATLADLGEASLSSYRCDELDAFNFLPLSYFGEPAQMTSTSVFDTEVNAGELDVVNDPTKVRNVVTVDFPETRVDTNVTPVFTLSSSVEVPRGKSQITFALDIPCVEIWSEGNPGNLVSGNWFLANLTALQIAGTNPLPTFGHYFSGNVNAEGSGTVTSALSITGRVVSATASTVTVEFINKMSKSGWIANNGNSIPFLVIRGIAYRVTDGYITARNPGSAGRRERALESEIYWLQSRAEAGRIASLLASMLSRPRSQVGMTVMGDPRRKPGQLVTVADAEGTQAAGTWRVLAITNNSAGAQFTQDLALVQVLPVAVWDGPDGWDYSIWGV